MTPQTLRNIAWHLIPSRMREGKMLLIFAFGMFSMAAIASLGFITPSLASPASRYGAMATIALVLFLLNVGLPVGWGLGMVSTYIAADVAWAAWSSQGIFSPRINWLFLIPVLMFQMVSRKAGWLSAALVAILFLMLSYATFYQLLPSFTAFDNTHEIYGFIVYVVTAASLIGVSQAYQSFANESLQQIKNHNIELEKKRQELQNILDARDQFIASVSHELRTPMNAILGFNELLREHQAHNPKAQEILKLTHQSGEHLLTVINDVLDYSQFQSGKLNIHPEAFELNLILSGATGLFVNRLKSMRLAFEKYLDPALPAWILADRHRLTQVLVNLLGNAIKFTQRGHVRLSIKRDGNHILFEIEDTGIGISPDQLSKVFERFSQATQQTQQLYGGNGLGLAISKRLVELMGGRIGVKSELGVGSCFWFTLPLVEAQPPQKLDAQSHSSRLMDLKTRPWRFLIVDDMAFNRLLLRQMLQVECPMAKISEAENGLSALLTMKISDFDLVYMDMVMPQLDGIEACKRIRSELPAPGRNTPIMGLSANVNPIDRERFIQAGAGGFLLKPFDRQSLMDNTERLLMTTPLGSASKSQ